MVGDALGSGFMRCQPENRHTPDTPRGAETPDGDREADGDNQSVNPEIVVRGLNFAYAGARGGEVFETAAQRRARRAGLAPQTSQDIPALVDINLECLPGTLTLLCGASGCGKSTLLRALNGLVPFFHRGTLTGTVEVGGLQVPNAPLALLGDTSATVFQNPRTQFFTADVASELAFRAENAGEPPAQIWQDIRQASEQLDTVKFLGRSLGALSGGELQKIACTSALASRRRILLFDEPTSNLSPQAIGEFAGILAQLKTLGYTLVVAEHRLYFLAGLADRVLVLDHGRVIRDYRGSEFFVLEESTRLDLGLRALREPTLESATAHLRPQSQPAPHEPEANRATLNATTTDTPTSGENPNAASEHKFATQGASAKTTHQGRFFTASPVTAPLSGLRRAAQPAKPTGNAELEPAPHEPADLIQLYPAPKPSAEPPTETLDTPLGKTPTSGLRLENLRFAYGKRQILDIPDFTFPAGQVSVLVGQNGVGKTTLSRIICGLAKASGRINLDGRELSRRERQRAAYIVMQDVHRQLFADTVLAEVTLGQKPYREAHAQGSRMAPPPERIQEILTDLDLWELRERHPLSLSGGQKQRLVIASALAWRKQVYIFDEPTSGVDYRHLVQIAAQLRALARAGAVVIVVTHDFELVQHAADAVIRLAPHEPGPSNYVVS